MRLKLLFACLAVANSVISQVKTGEDIIKAMYNTYHNKWYKYFTFTQDAIFYKDGKEEKTEVWYEAAAFPGNLIIKYDSMSSKNGVVFTNNMVTGIKDGVIKTSKPFIHDLLLVGFDVYFLKPETSVHILDSLGYNLKLVREDEFEGRKVFVAGAEKGNETSNQFWIDKERLYMHRIIYKKNDKITDVIFADYEKMNGNWVAKKVIFKNNGNLQLMEKYYNIAFPSSINPSVFETEKFLDAKW